MLKWVATILSVLGAFLVANMLYLPGYILFLLGGMGWAYIGAINKDKALFTMQGVFMVANLLGLYNAIFRG